MKITIADLRKITELLLQHAEETGSEEIEIDKDFYWHVPSDQRYDPYSKPAELSLGQLSDDWVELKRMADGDAELVNYALVWLAAIFARIGETRRD